MIRRFVFSGISGFFFAVIVMAVLGAIALKTSFAIFGLIIILPGVVAVIKLVGLVSGLVVSIINFFGAGYFLNTKRSV